MARAILIVLAMVCGVAVAQPNPFEELRYCGTPKRNEDGEIVRNSAVLKVFKALHPCPSTGQRSGACPGWAMDHVIPLACGGCDSVSNLQWLPNSWKSSPSRLAKDRFERLVYGQMPPFPDTEACTYVTPERAIRF